MILVCLVVQGYCDVVLGVIENLPLLNSGDAVTIADSPLRRYKGGGAC